MIIYLMGVLIALCINIIILFCVARDKKRVTLQDVFCTLAISIISWVEVAVVVLTIVMYLIENSNNIVIWQSRKKKE